MIPEITVLQLPKFQAEATELIGMDGIVALAAYLASYPDAGDVIPSARGSAQGPLGCKGQGNEKKQLRQIAAHLKGTN